MPREIITSSYAPLNNAPVGTPPDGYKERLLKYIPAEVVTAYMALRGIVTGTRANSSQIAIWVIVGIGVIGTIVYLRRSMTVPNNKQIFISTIAFLIWAIAMGEPFVSLVPEANRGDFYLWTGIGLTTFTFAVAAYEP